MGRIPSLCYFLSSPLVLAVPNYWLVELLPIVSRTLTQFADRNAVIKQQIVLSTDFSFAFGLFVLNVVECVLG